MIPRSRVFPACAGVVRDTRRTCSGCRGVPRVCGGGPCALCTIASTQRCSPRVRGWSWGGIHEKAPPGVFPACAGVVRVIPRMKKPLPGVPRVCGGGPGASPSRSRCRGCSPRVRGWSPRRHRLRRGCRVFPACAGVVPRAHRGHGAGHGVPRVCGGGPQDPEFPPPTGKCSPRVRGWSPDLHRSVIGPVRVPRVCGGGPTDLTRVAADDRCSPRVRGWSRGSWPHPAPAGVFPACAGVVPAGRAPWRRRRRVPRVCGGGPVVPSAVALANECSPRVRGWS